MKRIIMCAVLGLLVSASMAWGQVVVTLYDINTGGVAEGTQVIVEDVIVTGVAYNGFYIQEQAGGPFSGAWFYWGVAPGAIVGDLVTVEGEYMEYYGMTEIFASGGAGNFTVNGTGYFPEPYVARAAEINTTHPENAEQWECVLVAILNVELTIPPDQYGQWWVQEFGVGDPDIIMIDDQLDISGPTEIGTQMASITGCLRWDFDDFKIEPRFESDIDYIGAAPPPQIDWVCPTGEASIDVRFDRDVEETSAGNPDNYFLDIGLISDAVRDTEDLQLVHLTCAEPMTPAILLTITIAGVQNTDGIPINTPQDAIFLGGINSIAAVQFPDAGGDSSAVAGYPALIKGVVHSKYDIWGSHVFLQEVNAPGAEHIPYNGIEIYMTSLLETVEVGDILLIGDPVGEYFNMTSMTEPFYHFENLSSGNPVLEPETIPIGPDPIDPGYYEVYEGALVEFQNVMVIERPGEWNFYDWMVTQDPFFLESIRVGGMGDYDYNPGLGDSLNIRGAIRFEFGEFKIMPRSDDDIDELYINPISAPELPGVGTMLGQNFPNPFNPTTKIAFRLAEAGMAELAVFDVQGRLIKTLSTGSLPAGDHQVIWNGDTEQGEAAASGLYFYTLKTADETQTRRMVLLK